MTKLSFAIVFVVFVHGCYGMTGSKLVFDCFDKWEDIPMTGDETDQEIHCARMQNLINCLGEEPSKPSPFLDLNRFYLEQESHFININNYCNIDLTPVEEDVAQSGLKQKYHHLTMQENEKLSHCAIEVYTACQDIYNTLYEKGKKCAAFDRFTSCFQSALDKAVCEAPILKQFASFNNVIGRAIIRKTIELTSDSCTE